MTNYQELSDPMTQVERQIFGRSIAAASGMNAGDAKRGVHCLLRLGKTIKSNIGTIIPNLAERKSNPRNE